MLLVRKGIYIGAGAALATALALLLLVAPPPAFAVDEVATERVGQDAAAVRSYWTPARMAAAEPVEPPPEELTLPDSPPAPGAAPSYVPPPQHGGAAELRRGAVAPASGKRDKRNKRNRINRREVRNPAAKRVRAHGKVYFTITNGAEKGDWVCSGTAVNSRNRNVVWTAGHCVWDFFGGSGFVANWTFVPARSRGDNPFGRWPARKLATTRQWRKRGNLGYDLGAAVVRRNRDGRRLQGVVGARGIAFDQRRKQRYRAFGYPKVALGVTPEPFDGERQYRCLSKLRGGDSANGGAPPALRINCDMTAGSSGGGWIARGSVLSVTSYTRDGDHRHLYGPYMSTTAKHLYKSVRGKRKARNRKRRNHRHRSGGVAAG